MRKKTGERARRSLAGMLLTGALLWGAPQAAHAQLSFTSGPIPLCSTTYFTVFVGGGGTLVASWDWGYFVDNVSVNITTTHPETLEIWLVAPNGTSVLLSANNGAGGQNYVGTQFTNYGWDDITQASAPFTGTYWPQGGMLDDFAGAPMGGEWSLMIVDNACDDTDGDGQPDYNGDPSPGWLDDAMGGGTLSFGYNDDGGWNPCLIDMGYTTMSICPGQSLNLVQPLENQWGGGYAINWTVYDGGGNQVTDPTAITTPDYYYVEGYDPITFCNLYGNVDVMQGVGADLGPDQLAERCADGGAVDLTQLFDFSGAPMVSWNFNGNPISVWDVQAATQAGIYEVFTDGDCADTAQVTLSITDGPDLGPDQSVTGCDSYGVDLVALFPNAIGLSSDWTLDGLPIAPPTEATEEGLYEILAMSWDGCTATASVTLTMEPAPDIGDDQTITICEEQSADLSNLYTTGSYPYTWTYQGNVINDVSAVEQAGDYVLVAVAGNGCTDTAVVTLNVNPIPDLGNDQTGVICDGQTANLNTFFNTPGLTTAWTFGGNPVANPGSVTTAGTYTVVASDIGGCSDEANLELVVAPVPDLGPDVAVTACAGTPLQLSSTLPSGQGTMSWEGSSGPISPPFVATQAGTYTATVMTPDGCSDQATVTVVMNPAPSLGNDQSIVECFGASVDLTSYYDTDGLLADWTWQGMPVADPTEATNPGYYQLVVTNSYSCTDTALLIYTVYPNPDLGPDRTFAICPWQSVNLRTAFNVAGMQAEYTFNGQPVANPNVVTEAGVYIVSVLNSYGCITEARATVIPVDCACEADFSYYGGCVQEPVRFALHADSLVMGVQWSFSGFAQPTNETHPEVDLSSSGGQVLVTLIATLGCGVDTVQRIVSLPDCSDSCQVYVPNAFTPDGDDVNDRWIYVSECVPDDYEVWVYDRWGELVFHTTDPFLAWDGNFDGSQAPVGVYVWKMGYRLLYREDREQKVGHVVLVR